MTLICREPIQVARPNPTAPMRAVERGRHRDRARRRPGNVWAALILVVLTPMIAEVTLGTTPLAMAWLVLVYLPIYGAGVLLIRELVRRTGGGWVTVLLLGVAYGLVVEGIVLQSLTSPTPDGTAGWVPRVLGVNAAYAELTLVYHAVFSVAIPIALVELLFARHGRAPYLDQAGMVRCSATALLGVALLRILMSPNTDADGVAPPAALLTFAVLAGVLGVLALLVLPNLTSRFGQASSPHGVTAMEAALRPAIVPRPAVVAAFCGTTMLVFLSLLFPVGVTRHAAVIDGFWVMAAMISAALLVVITALVVRRYSAAPSWTDRHRLAVMTGPLIAHTVFGAAAVAHTFVDAVALTILGIIMVGALSALDYRLQIRCGLASSAASLRPVSRI